MNNSSNDFPSAILLVNGKEKVLPDAVYTDTSLVSVSKPTPCLPKVFRTIALAFFLTSFCLAYDSPSFVSSAKPTR